MYHVSWPWDGIRMQGSQLVLARLKGDASNTFTCQLFNETF